MEANLDAKYRDRAEELAREMEANVATEREELRKKHEKRFAAEVEADRLRCEESVREAKRQQEEEVAAAQQAMSAAHATKSAEVHAEVRKAYDERLATEAAAERP